MKRSVYVIDDNRLIANSLVQMLGLLGHEAQAAYGSLPALQALAQQVPQIIMVDIHMQGVNGVEVIRYLRRDPRMAKVIIVGMSTEAQPDMIERVRQAGADGFLPKPIEIEALEKVLQQIEAILGADDPARK